MTAFLFPNKFIVVAILALLKVTSIASLNRDDDELRFNENTMIMSHNSAANKDAAEGNFFKLFASDQENSMYEQLTTNGVRGLSLDIKLDSSDRSKLRLVHGPIDYDDFETEMQTHLVLFLEENDDAVVAINFEVVDADQATISTILANLKNTFSNLYVNGVTLADMTFKYNSELWANHDEWPTLNEMRSSGQRLFVFHDRSELRSTEYGFILRDDAMKENFWEGLDDCTARYQWDADKVSFPNSNLSWSRLFFMNHFDSIADTVGEGLLGGGINGWGRLYPRIKQCMESNGFIKPNFISLDWVIQAEEALEVAQYLNFGGRIGSGQRCLDDTHCATEACNTILGLCQCKECLPVDSILLGSDSCLGCETGQYCAAVENNLNECVDNPNSATSSSPVKEPTVSPTTYPLSASPTYMPVVATVSPTASPTAPPSSMLPTDMPTKETGSPTTTTTTTSPSPTTNLPTADENATKLAPTASLLAPATTQTPTGIQSQANIANVKDSDEYENNAYTIFETLSRKKIVLVTSVLCQTLLFQLL